ncbi:hypothetical protein SYNPS1DRAFT_21884 [Syncephalis pseudoplumigaleata]|uniref:SERTA domain-containing protein n=1 Tax=Syncephalis pseudoplumigaleata TaxID=1712513 RepID=A0A4P9Z1L6_9FUNG|nr:hypothetical protein SYNPS1DRAFT_21884 [Syncephalis pseudoplumigaleata]|eukprot:RKP26334.1 hypothetical protein SYNPS1DRAFT_21884 [Syncephalis pseudoplumigaleata]
MVSVTADVYYAVRDLSLDKLQAIAAARQEPALRRSVLIANLLRQPVAIMAHTPVIHVDADGDLCLAGTDAASGHFFFDEHEPVVPLNYGASHASSAGDSDDSALLDSRLAEEAWFDACFAELDDAQDDEFDLEDDDDATYGHQRNGALITTNNNNDMVVDDVDMQDTGRHSPPADSPPDLSPGLSDAGDCDASSDAEATTPPSLGKLVDTAIIIIDGDDADGDEAIADDWWPIPAKDKHQHHHRTIYQQHHHHPVTRTLSSSSFY